MKYILFSGIFHTNKIWESLIKELGIKPEEITYINFYNDPYTLPEKGEEYIAITISAGYREYLQYRKIYKFKSSYHLSPALEVSRIKLWAKLYTLILRKLPKALILNKYIFNLKRLITGDELNSDPSRYYNNLKNRENIEILEMLTEDIEDTVKGDKYLYGKRDKLLIHKQVTREFETGHNSILSNDEVLKYIKGAIKWEK